MKIILSENSIFLDNDDQLLIKTKKGFLLILCLDGTFVIDNISLKEIQHFIFHQTTKQMVALKKLLRLNIPHIKIRTLYHNHHQIILNKDESIYLPE